MSATWETFQRLKTRGLDARRAGNLAAARVYLLEAASAALELSKSARTPELADARRQAAGRLLDLARDSTNRRAAPTAQPAGDPAENAGGADASSWIVREKPAIGFDDIAGLEDVKEQIRLRMLYPFAHPELAARFGIRPGGGVLLYGPPGTGKTMLARATAAEMDATFFMVSPAELLSKWVGEAEQNVKKLFDAAAAEPRAIIFLDEIESLVPARRDDGSSVMQRVVPQILQSMDGFSKSAGLFFLAATNVPWQLDPAVLRPGRFDERIHIPLPDCAARMQLLEMHLRHRPLADEVDLDGLADRLEGFSGADIRYICEKAAAIPFMRAIASPQSDPLITPAILDEVVAAAPRSVTAEMVRRFQQWGGGG